MRPGYLQVCLGLVCFPEGTKLSKSLEGSPVPSSEHGRSGAGRTCAPSGRAATSAVVLGWVLCWWYLMYVTSLPSLSRCHLQSRILDRLLLQLLNTELDSSESLMNPISESKCLLCRGNNIFKKEKQLQEKFPSWEHGVIFKITEVFLQVPLLLHTYLVGSKSSRQSFSNSKWELQDLGAKH